MKLNIRYKLGLLLVALFTTHCRFDDSFYSNVFRSDVFTQLYSSAAYDFLWVFDNSDSMQDKRDYVRDNLNTFLGILNSRKAINYQMAMTTTDFFSNAGALIAGAGAVKVALSTNPDPVATFSSIINNISSSVTSFWEQGLESAYQAIANEGNVFMRNGVPLIIIFVTDEDDYSCQANCFGVEPENNVNWVPFPVSRYSDYFTQVKAAQNVTTTVFAIVGTDVSNCVVASNGLRYMSTIGGVGLGDSGSICLTQIESTYQMIAQTIANRGTSFELSAQASGAGIKVYVNSVEVPYSPDNGYIFDSATNSIVFTGTSIPANGAIIEVTYTKQTS